MSDRISLIVMVLMVIYGIYVLFTVSDKHHALNMKEKEDIYLSFLSDQNEDETDDSDTFLE